MLSGEIQKSLEKYKRKTPAPIERTAAPNEPWGLCGCLGASGSVVLVVVWVSWYSGLATYTGLLMLVCCEIEQM